MSTAILIVALPEGGFLVSEGDQGPPKAAFESMDSLVVWLRSAFGLTQPHVGPAQYRDKQWVYCQNGALKVTLPDG